MQLSFHNLVTITIHLVESMANATKTGYVTVILDIMETRVMKVWIYIYSNEAFTIYLYSCICATPLPFK